MRLALAIPLIALATTSPLIALDPGMQRQYEQAIREFPPGDYLHLPPRRFDRFSAGYGVADTRLQNKLAQLIIPTFECRDSTIHEALRRLAEQCALSDPEREKIPITFDPSTQTEAATRRLRDQKITLTLKNTSAAAILNQLLERTDLWYQHRQTDILILTLDPVMSRPGT